MLTFRCTQDDDWDDELGDDTEQSDDEDDDDLPVEGWVDTAWSISVPEPDAPEGEVSDMGDLAELNSSADSLQTSSRQLQRELAAPGSPSASPSALAGTDLGTSIACASPNHSELCVPDRRCTRHD